MRALKSKQVSALSRPQDWMPPRTEEPRSGVQALMPRLPQTCLPQRYPLRER
jgi:hypothetical protein